jgi:hypothetical protein
MTDIIRGLGLHKPDPAKLARRMGVQAHPRFASGTPRGSAMLAIWNVLDQGQTETCHAASEAQGVWIARAQIGRPIDFPSPRLIASCTYADTQGPASARATLRDTGADLLDDANTTATWGVGRYKGPTADGRVYDVETPRDATFPEPDPTELVISGADLITGQYQIPVDDQAMIACCLALDAGIPLQPGGPVNDVYQGLSGANAVATSATAPGGGGHARLWVGYREISPGVYQLRELNSWGTGWADGGFTWVDASRVACEWSILAMAVK